MADEIKATELCQKLADQLDGNPISFTIKEVVDLLDTMPNDVALELIRKHIGIDRIIKHNLDKDPVFLPLLDKLRTT